MTPEQIEELRADMAAGTPGPWFLHFSPTYFSVSAPAILPKKHGPQSNVVARMAITPLSNLASHGAANARRIARVPTLEAEVLRLTEANAALAQELARMRELLADAVEDETEFETEWNKAARAALSHTGMTGQREGV
jgi:hypothetical protein